MARVPPRSSRPTASSTRCCPASPSARTLGSRFVELDEHDREFAVLARGQVDFAPQLVVEVGAACTGPVDGITQRLVGQLPAQQLVGALLLFDLLQRSAQLCFALAAQAPGLVQTLTQLSQRRPSSVRRCGTMRSTEKLAALAVELEAGVRPSIGAPWDSDRLLGGTQHRRHRRLRTGRLSVQPGDVRQDRPAQPGSAIAALACTQRPLRDVLDRQEITLAHQHRVQQCSLPSQHAGTSSR